MLTDQEKIPTRNVIDSHAKDLVANGDFYYPSRENSHIALADYPLLEIPDVFSLCAVAEQTAARTNSSTVVLQLSVPPHRTTQTYYPRESLFKL